MVITDFDTNYTSREASGRFQVSLEQHQSFDTKHGPAGNRTQPIQFETQRPFDRENRYA